eukprot:1967027-Pyramimonas_sp.AAC.1
MLPDGVNIARTLPLLELSSLLVHAPTPMGDRSCPREGGVRMIWTRRLESSRRGKVRARWFQ